MKRRKRFVVLVFLGLIEIVLISFALAPNLPRRSSELSVFMRYEKNPTIENKELWLKERRAAVHEVRVRKLIGYSLATINVLLIIYVIRQGRRAGEHLQAAGIGREDHL